MSDKKVRTSGQGAAFKQQGKKKTATQHLSAINKNPEDYGITRAHVTKIDNETKKTDKILDGHVSSGKTVDKDRVMEKGLVVRANGRLGVIMEINEGITVKFPTGSVKEYHKDKVTFCRDQQKADKQLQDDINRRST